MTNVKQMLNKVPEVTFYFWIIKIACTTVGETAADYLAFNLHFGLSNTTILMSVLLVLGLFIQFKMKKYVPWTYWLAVVLISIVGTLITDNLTDNLDVALELTTTIFSIALAITFILWYAFEKTLSIHTIFTTKRETFYWIAILFTFALGTAAGDLIAEQFKVGYFNSGLLFGGLILAVTISYYAFKINVVLSFWIAYILTRPLGASIGDYLSQSHKHGGIGLGPTKTSVYLLILIFSLIIYLSITKKDVTKISD